MGGPDTQTGDIRDLLRIAKENENGQIKPEVTQALRQAMAALWNRIRTNSSTYIMSRDEFSLINYYQSDYKDNEIAQDAVKRFWANYSGTSHPGNGPPDTSSTPT